VCIGPGESSRAGKLSGGAFKMPSLKDPQTLCDPLRQPVYVSAWAADSPGAGRDG
jgi:hypothetical protein